MASYHCRTGYTDLKVFGIAPIRRLLAILCLALLLLALFSPAPFTAVPFLFFFAIFFVVSVPPVIRRYHVRPFPCLSLRPTRAP